ncbi:MAG: hypothetical protein ACRDJO_13615, partial [Actinomycetota bacterium]
MGSNREPDGRGAGHSPQELLDTIRARGIILRRRRAVGRLAVAVALPVTTLVAAFTVLPQLTTPSATTINVAGGSPGDGPTTGAGGAPQAPGPGGAEAEATPTPSVSPSPPVPVATPGPATKPPKSRPGPVGVPPAEPTTPEVTAAPAEPAA